MTSGGHVESGKCGRGPWVLCLLVPRPLPPLNSSQGDSDSLAVSIAVWRDSPARGGSLRPRRCGSVAVQLRLESQLPGQGGSWSLLSSLPSAFCLDVQAAK